MINIREALKGSALTLAALLVVGSAFSAASGESPYSPSSLLASALSAVSGNALVSIARDTSSPRGPITVGTSQSIDVFKLSTRNVSMQATVKDLTMLVTLSGAASDVAASDFRLVYRYCIPLGVTYGYGYQGGACSESTLSPSGVEKVRTGYRLSFTTPIVVYPEKSAATLTLYAYPSFIATGSRNVAIRSSVTNATVTADQCKTISPATSSTCALVTPRVSIANAVGHTILLTRPPEYRSLHPSATINASTLAGGNAARTLTGTARNTATIDMQITLMATSTATSTRPFPDPTAAFYKSAIPVVNTTWSVTVTTLPKGSYQVTLYASDTTHRLLAQENFAVTASSLIGTYRGYMNGALFIQTKDITRADALANCKLNAAKNPGKQIRCTWEGVEVFSNTGPVGSAEVQYLAFQLFTNIDSEKQRENYPPLDQSIKTVATQIIRAVGSTGTGNRKLGFFVGPIAFDTTDEKVREVIRESFAVALDTGMAAGFHIDESMFWGRLSHLNKIENIEWLDWNKKPNTGRRLDWSATSTEIMPQLCVNSPAVVAEVKKRAALIGEEVKRGIAALAAAGKEDLFIGVGAGWETMLGRDFVSGKYLGYCALTNKGYGATNPPKDIDQARVDIVKEFIDMWATELARAGIPETKIYSHIALTPQITSVTPGQSHLQSINFTPISVAYGPNRYAGFSTYPGSTNHAEIKAARAKNGGQPWASMEGTALDPSQAELGTTGDSMEAYLGNMFNHGAALVNVFGWGMGPSSNSFRITAEKASSIAAYKKFLSGAVLAEGPVSSGGVQDKVQKIQSNIEAWVAAHPSEQPNLTSKMQSLDGYLRAGDLANAMKVADTVLRMMGL